MTTSAASSRRHLFSRYSTDIAATSCFHSMIVVTRNVKDFASFGVKVFNPFSTR
jgi:predicted nucleic acid-binding protein